MNPEFIAHYRIVEKLGEGGMGAVYRAADTKLHRDVAIKILPAALADDPDYLARFSREAQVLASLNHPNIATIFGVEEKALVMELVPGQTLDQMIASGPIPLEEALALAVQIAEALEAAHEKGVIHRDLKPANVKVTPEGVLKVLDFGLAKAADPASSAPNANSPTLTLRATQIGVIMGTAGYMAPEQAAGKPVDRRADIWAFGVVLYELLTGKTLFTGETVSHTLASVLKDPIDFDLPQAPPPIRRLLARCLNRNAKDRLRDIGEARIAIRAYLTNPSAEAETKAPAALITPVKGSGYWIPRILCAVLFVALSVIVDFSFKSSPPLAITRFLFALPSDQTVTNVNRGALAISPDGTQIVYVANGQLYLRSMSEWEGRPIPGTRPDDLITNPVFSPDGKSLAFFAGGTTLKRIAAGGGAAVTLADAPIPVGAHWTDTGILFADYTKGIHRVSPNGGQPETLIAAKQFELLADPQLLPGGEAVLFSLSDNFGGVTSLSSNRWRIAVQTLKSGVRKTLVEGATGARYLSTGHLVYWMNGVLFAVPFNPRRLEIRGSPVGIVEGIAGSLGSAHYAFSNTGTLIYRAGPVGGAGLAVLARVDRKGEIEPLKVPSAAYAFPRVSRDGKRVTYQIDDGAGSAVWVWELAGDSAPRRLTLPGTGNNRYPIWSPDGQWISYQSDRAGELGIWRQLADGTGAAEQLTTPAKGISHIPDSWSPDGQTLSFTEEKDTLSEVWTFSLRDRKAAVFAAEAGGSLGRSAFSPDGRWVDYQVARPPASRIYVRPFPPSGTAYEAPQDNDTHHPVWSPDGKELFYVAGASQFGSMSVSTKPTVTFGTPVRAPRSGFVTGAPGAVRTYDVLPDGRHFIGVVQAGQTQATSTGSQIQVVLNWFEDLKQRAPVK